MSRIKIFTLLSLVFTLLFVAESVGASNKSIYIPSFFGNMDLNDETSQWCYQRSQESDNFILFWETGYGSDPATNSNNSYKVNVDAVLDVAESSFAMYRDSLKFIEEGNSKTDNYKMIILLFYTTDWIATGSGVDDTIGLLNLSAWAAQALGVTVAHEVGHCFQYQVACDGHIGGWRYGFGSQGSGGNCWWEQCAQWQAFKVFPERQFTDYEFSEYLASTHKHILHEAPRYANYFIQDYWTYLHGMDFIGKLWRDSKYPEDPVEAYKRITGISQSQFNDEIYDCASRFATWDIPTLKQYGANYIDARGSDKMNQTGDDYWQIDPSECLENYGYNVIRLNVPEDNNPVTVYFEGMAGASGYRNAYNKIYAGWRYGIVGLLDNGNRIYSDMRSPSYLQSGANPKDTLSFQCPDNCVKLWMVVTGAPFGHWRHAWDDDDSNDEQWPYKVKFENTNLFGVYTFTDEEIPHSDTRVQNITLKPATSYESTLLQGNVESLCKAFKLSLQEVIDNFGSSIKYCAVEPSGTPNYVSTANAPGHWFNKNGYVTNWGNNSYIFSELNSESLTFNIGQYPNLCKEGDQFTIRQGLVYTPASGPSVTFTYVFNISISSEIVTDVQDVQANHSTSPVISTVVKDLLYLSKIFGKVMVFNLNGQLVKQASNVQNLYLGDLSDGIYIVKTDKASTKIVKIRY